MVLQKKLQDIVLEFPDDIEAKALLALGLYTLLQQLESNFIAPNVLWNASHSFATFSHKVPDGDLTAVLREAVRCAVEHHGKRRGAVKPARFKAIR